MTDKAKDTKARRLTRAEAFKCVRESKGKARFVKFEDGEDGKTYVAVAGTDGEPTAKLSDGLVTALVFGLAGIIAQVVVIRVFEFAMRLDIGAMLAAEKFTPASAVVAAANVALGLVVAVSVS